MKLRDLDTETKGVICAAELFAMKPSNQGLRLLRRALKAFEAKHEKERTENLLRAIFSDEDKPAHA